MLLGSTEIVTGGEYLDRFWDRLTAVTPEAMQRAAGRIFAERNRTVGWYVPALSTPAAVPAAAGTTTEAAARA